MKLVWGRTILLVACAVAPSSSAMRAADTEPVCLPQRLRPAPVGNLVRWSIDVLEGTGRSASDFRVELRSEPAVHPDVAGLSGPRATTVVFVPRSGVASDESLSLYPLRVHPAEPCAVSWIWQPERFTPWQRRVVERAREEGRNLGFDETPFDVQVAETADAVLVRVWRTSKSEPQSEPDLTIRIDKRDLHPRSREPG